MFTTLVILLGIISRTFSWSPTPQQLCDNVTSVDISNGIHMENGIIFHNGVRYEKGEYYVDNITSIERGCVCLKETCVRKCCPFGFGYDAALKQCVRVADVFDPPIWDEDVRLKDVHARQIFHFLHDIVNCTQWNNESYRIRITKLSEEFQVRTDGQLYIELPDELPPWTLRTPDQYCLDTFVVEDDDGNKFTKLDALVCFVDDPADNHNYLLSSICMLISMVFILVTLGVYAWLPELRNLYGKVLMAYLACLLVAFFLLTCMQLMLYVNNIGSNFCLVLTFIIYFSLLSAFFWMNVMCFDIYWTFSGKRGLALEKLSSQGRFLAYSVYAFGIPTLLTVLLAGLEFSGLPIHPLMPAIRHHGCFIHGKRKLLYLYGPILILCVANISFFTLTAIRIAGVNKQTSVLHSKESATHDTQRKDKQRLLLYIKLFCVMGVSWILEVFAALYPEANDIWQITDSYNVLIGVIIFIIFVCKRKIFRLIKKRYKQMRGYPMSRTVTVSSRTVSSQADLRMSSVKVTLLSDWNRDRSTKLITHQPNIPIVSFVLPPQKQFL